jgi:hypothetical protein
MKKTITDIAAKHSWALQLTRPWEIERYAHANSPVADINRRSLLAKTKAVVAYDRIINDLPPGIKF